MCFTGAADSIQEYYKQSVEAESRVNQATTDMHSPVEQSAGLRQATQAKLDAIKGEFELRQRLDSEILNTLKEELEQDDLSQLSQQVSRSSNLRLFEKLDYVA